MLSKIAETLLVRDLGRLKEEISRYSSETAIWQVKKDISNSAGNLCLHLIGNLNTYIGAALGNNPYVRNREAEFSLKNIPQQELLEMIDDTILVVQQTLGSLSPADLEKEFPMQVFDRKTSVEYMLVHLCTHLTYHLGQVNYHRRLLE